jgi:chromosome segregation ATPase
LARSADLGHTGPALKAEKLSPPEHIRRYLESHGGRADAHIAHLMRDFKIEELTESHIATMSEALAEAGIRPEPPLSEVGEDDRLTLHLAGDDAEHHRHGLTERLRRRRAAQALDSPQGSGNGVQEVKTNVKPVEPKASAKQPEASAKQPEVPAKQPEAEAKSAEAGPKQPEGQVSAVRQALTDVLVGPDRRVEVERHLDVLLGEVHRNELEQQEQLRRELEKRVADVEGRLKESEKNAGELAAKLEKEQAAHKAAQAKAQELEKQVPELKGRLDKTGTELEAAAAERKSAAEELATAQSEIDNVKAQAEEWMGKARELLATSKSDFESEKKKRGELETRHSELQAKHGELDKRLTAADKTASDLKQSLERKGAESEQREAEQAPADIKSRSRRAVEKAEKQVEETKAELEAQRQQRAKVEHDLEATEKKRAATEQRRVEAEQERAKVERLRAGVEQQHKEALAKVKQLEGTITDARERASHADQALVDAHAQTEAERKQRVEVQKELESANETRTLLEHQRTDVEQRLTAQLEATRRDGRKAIDEARHAASEARAELEREHAHRAQLEHQARAAAAKTAAAKTVAADAKTVAAEAQAAKAAAVAKSATEKAEAKAAKATAAQPAPARAKVQPLPGERKRKGLLRRKSSEDTTAQAHSCSVCKKVPESTDLAALKKGGWAANGNSLLCPDCQRDGWELPAGSTFPYRRSTERRA